MHSHDNSGDRDFAQRRKVLTLLGTSAVALPVLGLAGCGGGDDAPAPSVGAMEDAAKDAAAEVESGAEKMVDEAQDAVDSAEETMTEAMDSAEAAVEETVEEAKTIATDAAGGMAQVDENSAQAQGLGYRHDATTIDGASQPRYKAGQQCSNCALYQGGDAEWGGCPLFAGKQVKATGWCNAYAPAA
jgi:hypothetical protein